MTREEKIALLIDELEDIRCDNFDIDTDEDKTLKEAIRVIKALEQEPCCNCIEFKRYAKQMGFEIKKESIPYLMHKEMNIPISECQKAYNIAMEYLRNKSTLKG